MRATVQQEMERPLYSRGFNPTVAMLRAKLAALEGTEDALVLSSGSAAVAAAVMSFVKAGDHIVCVEKPYSWTKKLLVELLDRFNVEHTFVDGTDAENYRRAMRPNTTFFITESPNSLTFELQDLGAVAAIAKERGIITLCDNSYNGPLYQNPITLGIDMVAHSATKYLNGHSDLTAGVLITRDDDDFWRRLRSIRVDIGGTLGSFEAWLLTRGLRTLHVRVERVCRSAQSIAEHFEQHPRIAAVLYPGLPACAGHDLAKRQMQGGFGGMLSIRVKGGEAAAIATAAHVQLWKRATSLGGTESLIEHRASVEGAGTPAPADLLRLSVGVEHVDDLIADLEQALAKARG